MQYAPGGPCPGAGRNTEVNSQTSEKKQEDFLDSLEPFKLFQIVRIIQKQFTGHFGNIKGSINRPNFNAELISDE